MAVKCVVKDNQQEISFVGDLTISHAQEFMKKINLKDSDAERVLIDLKEVENIDCAGVQLLLAIGKTLRDEKRLPPILVHGALSKEVFDLLNLTPHFYWEDRQPESLVTQVLKH